MILSSLRTRLGLVVLLAIVPLAALLLYNALRDRSSAEERVQEDAQVLVEQLVVRQEQLIESSRQVMASLAGLAASVDTASLDQESCGPIFQLLLSELTFYRNLGLVDAQGNLLCSALPAAGQVTVADTEWFQRASSQGAFAVGVYEPDGISGEPTLKFGYPIFGPGGRINSMLFLALDVDQLNETIASSEALGDAVFTLRDSRGTVILSYPDESRVGQTDPAPLEVAGARSSQDPDGSERLHAFTLVGDDPDIGLYADVGLPRGDAYAAADAELRRNLIALVAVGVLALGATFLVSDRLIVRPVRGLIDFSKRVTAGDLRARAPIEKERGELSELGRSLNSMASTLQTRIEQQENAEARLREANLRLERTIADLRRSNSDLEQFAYVASHDLQEPLRMVSSYTQLLARRYRDKLDSDADEFIDFAVDGARRMQALINDLLEFSRVGTNKTPFAAVDMNAVIEGVKSDLQFKLADSGAVLTCEPLPAVHGDEVQLRQLLQNLIENAIKFRGDEPPRVHVSARWRDGAWLFRVEDNGIGIPPDQTDRIFVIFQRLHGRDRYEGNGIGLSISKRIVERHGGKIWAEAREGGGSVFSFTLPPASTQPQAQAAVGNRDAA